MIYPTAAISDIRARSAVEDIVTTATDKRIVAAVTRNNAIAIASLE